MGDRPKVTETEWCGQPRYGCSACSFDTLVRERADEHVALAHYQAPPAKPDAAPVIVSEPNGLAPEPPAKRKG